MPCPALAQLHARNTGLTGLPSKTQKGEDTATPVNCRVKGQGIPLFFSPHVLNRSISNQLDTKNKH